MSGRYTLNEAAQKIGIHKITLYRWEKQGKIKPPKRLARNKERIFTDEDVALILEYKDRIIDPSQTAAP